jgi:putative flippase GtrA
MDSCASVDKQRVATENRRQVRRFLVVGGLSVAVDFVGYALLVLLWIPTPIAKGLSYIAGMVLGYFGNKHWTFGSRRRSISEPAAFAVLYAVTLVVNIGINSAVMAVLGPEVRVLAFLVATGTTTVLNFLGMRLVAFRAGIHNRLTTERHVPSAVRAPHGARIPTHELVNR